MRSVSQYKDLGTEDLLDELCILTSDLVSARRDHADLAISINRDFFQTFLDADGESVAGRNRLAEAATATLEQERILTESNIASICDLIGLIRTLLNRR